MDYSSMMASLSDVAKCHVCLGPLTLPRRLPCPHSFCTGCIEGLLQQAPPAQGAPKLRCPECKEEHTVPLGGVKAYPVDVRLQELVETMNLKENNQSHGLPRRENDQFQGRSSNPEDWYPGAELVTDNTCDGGMDSMMYQDWNPGPESLQNVQYDSLPPQFLPIPAPLPVPLGPRLKLQDDLSVLKAQINSISEGEKIAEAKGKFIRGEIDIAEVRCQIDEMFDLVKAQLITKLEERKIQLHEQLNPAQTEIQQNISVLDDFQSLQLGLPGIEWTVNKSEDMEAAREILDRAAVTLDSVRYAMDSRVKKYRLDDSDAKSILDKLDDFGRVTEMK